MQTANSKTQVSLNFETELLVQMKRRAKSLNRSFNSYILNLAKEDIMRSNALPKVSLPVQLDEDILVMAGCADKTPSTVELENDPRLEAIWTR